MKKEYNVSIIGLEIDNGNLGCVALALSFLNLLNRIGHELDATINVTAIGYSDKKYECDEIIRKYDVIRVHPKQLSFWKNLKRNFKNADIIFDFTLGDSFSDIYGVGRYVKTNLLKEAAERYNKRFILGPQTYGPYDRRWAEKWASRIIGKAFLVYSRDQKSADILKETCNKEVEVVTDVAFGLPYSRMDLEQTGKIKVAINPSGLLWAGGYTGDNQFALTIDYQKYTEEVVSRLTGDPRYEVYLLPHVGTVSGGGENDYEICKKLHVLFPESHVIDGIDSPITAKNHIAAMDVLIASRMHATVAGVSSGVATIPVAYSRKFRGLYDNIGYGYVLDVKELNTQEAIDQTIEWVENYTQLKKAAVECQRAVSDKMECFTSELIDIFKAI